MLRDFRFAFRMLWRRPGLTLAAVITLALGIGTTSAMFSVVQRVVLAPLPVPQPQQLVILHERTPTAGRLNVSWADYLDWRQQTRSFSGLAAVQPGGTSTGAIHGKQVTVRMASVTGSLFSLLRSRFVVGGGFTRSEEEPGSPGAMILGYQLWEELGSNPRIIGTNFGPGSPPIVGVLRDNPRELPWSADVYVPLGPQAANPTFASRGNHPGLSVVGRLKPGVSVAQARAALGLVMQRLAKAYPATNGDENALLQPLDAYLNGSYRPELWLLLGAVSLVLLLACANLAHLLLAQASSRQREFAVRRAVGASRADLMRQSACETIVLTALGGGAGVLLAWWSIPLLVHWAPYPVPRMHQTQLNGTVVAFAAAAAVVAALLTGLAPALGAANVKLNERMKAFRGGRLHAGLLILEVALAVVVVAGASLLGRSLQRVLAVSPGFNINNLITLRIAHRPQGAQAYFEQTLARVRALPGVTGASAIMDPPLHGFHYTTPYQASGQVRLLPQKRPWAELNMALPGYFQTIGAHLRAGRFFNAADAAQAPLVAIVNATMARHMGGHALNQRLLVQDNDRQYTVVGVIDDLPQDSLTAPAWPEIIVPLAQFPGINAVALMVRARSAPAIVMHGLAKAVPSEELPELMTAALGKTLARRDFLVTLMAAFGLLALLLAALGIYAITAQRVAARTRDLSVRLALGASRSGLMHGVLLANLRPIGVGIAIGLAGAFFAGRFWGHLLFGVGAADPLALAGTCMLLVLVAVAACLGPAWHAAHTDPMTVLRGE